MLDLKNHAFGGRQFRFRLISDWNAMSYDLFVADLTQLVNHLRSAKAEVILISEPSVRGRSGRAPVWANHWNRSGQAPFLMKSTCTCMLNGDHPTVGNPQLHLPLYIGTNIKTELLPCSALHAYVHIGHSVDSLLIGEFQ